MLKAARKIVIECRCGLIRQVAVIGHLDDDEARRIIETPCPVCGNAGSGRIYSIVPLRPLRIVK